jgi:guanylate kinase
MSQKKKGVLFAVGSPTGAGKTTLIQEVIKRNPLLSRIVTYTTRPRREGEVHGSHYHFITKDEFAKQQLKNEWVLVAQYADNFYATNLSEIKDIFENEHHKILIVERQGCQELIELCKKYPEIHLSTLWIIPPSAHALKTRLIKRGTESLKERDKRIAMCEEEIEVEKKSPVFSQTIINDEFEQSLTEIEAFIQRELDSLK